MPLRLATPADLPLLADIERRAAERFSADDLPPHLRGATLPIETLQQAQAAGLLWVALAGSGAVVGFLAAQTCDGALHIAEMSVLPEHGGAGLGRSLLDAAANHGRDAGYPALTLTTFAQVPWNRPFYERTGFRSLSPEQCDDALRQRLEAESRAGLHNRLAMRRNLD